MSVSKLSDTLQQKILQGIVNRISDDLAKAQAAAPSKRFGSTVLTTKVTPVNLTRLLTDVNQTGVFGKEGLKDLKNGFNKIAANPVLVGPRVLAKDGTISKQAGYPNLKKYLKEQILANSSISELQALQNSVKFLAIKADEILSSNNLYDTFLTFVSNKQNVTILNEEVFSIEKTSHATINKLFNEFLLNTGQPTYLVEFISANTDAGHLLGIFNQKLYRTFGASISDNEYNIAELEVNILNNIEQSNNENKQALDNLNKTFSAAFNILESIDFLTSSLKTSPEIFVKLSKDVYTSNEPKSAAEIQISIDNTNIGRLLVDAGDKLNTLITSALAGPSITLFNPDGITSYQVKNPKAINFAKQVEGLLKDIGSLASVTKELAASLRSTENKLLNDYVQRIVLESDKLGNILLNAEGSDSVKTAIGKTIAAAITGKKLNPSKTIVSTKKASTTGKNKPVDTSKIKQLKVKSTTNSDIAAIKKVRRQTTKAPVAKSLTSLQNLLNANLVQRIKQNMGEGNRRDILNLRTGRFAESVKVERLSQSREGMITAFYNYMRNPYATFSDGGRQEIPRSRNPKLLIAKSIRELAAEQAITRLRAVLV